MARKLSAQDRFFAKVEKTEECWNWTASKNNKGYGQFRVGPKLHLAHRFAFEFANGHIPEGAQIDHTCHNRACVQPAHLRPATNKQNMENQSGVRADSKSGVRGVTWHKQSRRWLASVRHHKEQFYLGLFDNLADAESAVVAKRLQLFTHNDLDRAA